MLGAFKLNGLAKLLESPATYSVTPSTTSLNEGSSVTFNVTTTNVLNGTTLYWTLNTVSGTINTSDFTGGAVSGSFSISSNAGSVSLTLSNDTTTEGSESFQLQVRTDSISGTIVATSSTVTIGDTSVSGPWSKVTSNNFTVYRYGFGQSSLTLHGIVNTNQLVGTVAYQSSSSGTQHSMRGFVVDLSTGAVNIGSEYQPLATPSAGNWFGVCSAQENTAYGIWMGNGTANYGAQVKGYTITNYTSCNQSTAPTLSFGSTTQFNNGTNHGGNGFGAAHLGSGIHLVTHRTGGDDLAFGAYSWNGTTLSVSKASALSGTWGASYTKPSAFLSPSGATWGAHHFTADGNGNYVNADTYSNSGSNTDSTFYSTGKSSVGVSSAKINDTSGNSKTMVLAWNNDGAGTTARIRSTGTFLTSSWGSASVKAGMTGLLAVPYTSGNVFAFWINSGSGLISYVPITWSGTTCTWGNDTSTTLTTAYRDSSWMIQPYLHATYGNWFIRFAANTSNNGVIEAIKYTP